MDMLLSLEADRNTVKIDWQILTLNCDLSAHRHGQMHQLPG
jgi:hypothetical protein